MGTLYMGLDGLFVSILGILSLTELGIGPAMTYAMYKPLAERDDKEVCALLQFYKKCYHIIGSVILCIGLAILPFLKFFIKGDYPSDTNIYILYLIYLSNSVLSYFLYAYKNSLLTAMQRYDIVSNINSIIYIVQIFLQVSLLLTTKNYYFYILVMPLFTIIINLVTEWYSVKHYPQYVCTGTLTAERQAEIMTNVKGIISQKIGAVVLFSVDNIVISTFLGLNVLAIYNNYYYVVLALFSFSDILLASMTPSVGNSCISESRDKNFLDFRKFNFMYMYITAWGSAFLLCLCQSFIKLWVGENLMLAFSYVVLFTAYFFFFKWMDMLYVYLQATGIWWQTRYIPLVASACNLIANIVLVNIIGLSGVIISTIISILFIYNLGYLIAMLKFYFNRMEYLSRIILRQIYYLLVATISCCITYFISSLLSTQGILSILWRVIVCLIIPNLVMCTLFYRLSEFKHSKIFWENVLHNLARKKGSVVGN